jgi:hypothetical protein
VSGSDLGPWAPLSLDEVVTRFAAAPFRWWIGGGLALELHVGRSWRDHSDTDVGVVRGDAPLLVSVFPRWDLQVAAGGALTSWTGAPLLADRHQNNVWCRPDPASPWCLDMTIGDGDDDAWVFLRDPSVRIPWPEAVLDTADGIPYLAPELQLLFKSRDPRDKDTHDAREVIPALDPARRTRLADLLATDHPWRPLLDSA